MANVLGKRGCVGMASLPNKQSIRGALRALPNYELGAVRRAKAMGSAHGKAKHGKYVYVRATKQNTEHKHEALNINTNLYYFDTLPRFNVIYT